MDPRNPLGRLDRLSRYPAVRALRVTLEGGGAERSIEVQLATGSRRTFRAGVGTSWVGLLDRVQTWLDRVGGDEREAAREDAR